MDISCIILQLQDNSAYFLGFDNPLDSVDMCSITWVYMFVIFIEFDLGVDGFVTPLIPECETCRRIKDV